LNIADDTFGCPPKKRLDALNSGGWFGADPEIMGNWIILRTMGVAGLCTPHHQRIRNNAFRSDELTAAAQNHTLLDLHL
jgi:hypothetical protein